MAKARSPNYPTLDLGAALQAARKAYDKDHRNKMSRAVLAKHLGHESLSGPALGKIGALRAYGLIDGSGDELRVSDDAVHALMAPEGSSERAAAITKLATRPKLFQDIRKDFSGAVSIDNLKFWLIKRDFVPEAAEKAAKVYLASMRLAGDEFGDYNAPANEPEEEQAVIPAGTPDQKSRVPVMPPKPGMRQAVFPLGDGDVTLTFPEGLSVAGYEELEGYLEMFLKSAKRRADAIQRHKEMIGDTDDE
jgi:hypothetical protein